MFGRIRRLMRTPLAVPEPPGRLRRFAPEMCAGAVALCQIVVLSLIFDENDPELGIIHATAAGYALAGVLLFVIPMGLAAAAIAREHEKGTLEALLLTPASHTSLAWTRFWRLLGPWLRFAVYMLPLYGIMACSGFLSESARLSEGTLRSGEVFLAFAPKPLIASVLWDYGPLICACGARGGDAQLTFSFWGTALASLRLLTDLSVLSFVTAGAYYISARARSTARALVLSFLTVPLALTTALAFDFWIAMLWVEAGMAYYPYPVPSCVYMILAPLAVLLRFFLAWWLVRRVAKNFDAYATGERAKKR